MAYEWRLVRDGRRTASQNMAIDEAIMNSVGRGESPPTLRLYYWDPPTISVGYFQDLHEEVDLDACSRLGIDWVRRPTGGRAVLHDVEVTYSFIAPEAHPLIPKGIVESYRVISAGIIDALTKLGLEAELVPHAHRGQGRSPAGPGELSAACFEAPSWYEVVVHGRKIVGSAQTRRNGVLLQHGSVLVDLDVEKLFAVLRFPNELARERARERFRPRASAIRQALGRDVPLQDVEESLVQGFQTALELDFKATGLGQRELSDARMLELKKYSSDDWNIRRVDPLARNRRLA